jgi:putative ABC transport system ATP-binding protein
MKLLETKNLRLRLQGREHPIFENKAFYLEERQRISVTGPSGSGKSLFLRSLCLLEEHLEGEIFWRGHLVTDDQVTHFRSHVMYVGQKTSLPAGKVEDAFNEVFQFKAHREKKWHRERTVETLRFFGKPAQFLTQRLEVLSGGEKQIVNLLRAVELAPEVLCLDEPTSALDAVSTLKMEAWLNDHFHGAWLWVTHNREQAERVSTQNLRFPLGE